MLQVHAVRLNRNWRKQHGFDNKKRLPAPTRLSPPALILLYLNLPKMSGIEFLRELRNNPELNGLHLIVLASSNEPKNRATAYEHNVDD